MDFNVPSAIGPQIPNVVTQPTPSSNSKINWNDYNFPPCIHIVHFSLAELQGPVKRFVLCIYLSFLIIIGVLIINLLSTIIQVSKYTKGINMFFTFLNIVIFIPVSAFTAYSGYCGACRRPPESGTILRYKICQGVVCILWLVFSIIRGGCFNGWTRITLLKREKESAANFCIFLTVLESLGYTFSLILGLIGIIKVSDVSEEPLESEFPMPAKI
eukprot:TRINITY_DN1745_c0_g2_i17.p2 TRINITY_DN1745_c0_g2~~TRINITY_DN1745_c0_g2_i17.p2  ORF type:complete len:215 (+),score=46.32 TRINITY_DN1745_c0_g2_i17:124-768(+)